MKLKKLLLAGVLSVTLSTTMISSTLSNLGITVAADESSDSSNEENKGNAPRNGETPPEKPDGDMAAPPDGNGDGTTPPEKPDGDNDGNMPSGDMPSGEAPSGDMPNGEAPDGMGTGPNTQTFDYSGDYNGTLTVDGESKTSDGETITASDTDVNSVLVENGGTLEISGATLDKSGDDTSGDNCNFYGLNAILLTLNENSKTYISESTLTADSEGSNAIFATDSGTVYAYNDTITTTGNSARGLDATYGGIIVADSMTISTEGDHCATLATDRGGGSISVTNSSLSTKGSGSPLLYSTGDIEVSNVTGTASGSQIAAMEGLNTLIIDNSTLESTNTGKTASDPVANAIILYQSTSGDADTSTGSSALFEATNSTLTSKISEGSFFYITNTNINVLLSNTTLDYDSDAAKFITITGNDSNNWGTSGINGATSTFTLLNEEVTGDIEVDTISSLSYYVLKNSTYTGSTEIVENSDASETKDDNLTVNINDTSKWIVTKDSTVTNLNVSDPANITDADGKTVSIVNNGETVVEGDSDITVTVTGSYSNEVTTNEANSLSNPLTDRSEFDEYYGTSTAFTLNANAKTSVDSTDDTDDTKETVKESEKTDTEDTTKASDDNDKTEERNAILWIVFGVVIGAGLIISLIVMAIKNKKK